MVRDDKSKFLLFMEPTPEQRSGTAINDEYTNLLRVALSDAKIGKSNFKDTSGNPVEFKEGNKHRGTHKCSDGIISGQQDFLLPTGLITNSLCVHYMLFYRMAISKNDWDKIAELQRHYGRSAMPQTIDFNNKKSFM